MAAEARAIPMISVAGLGRGDAAATDRVVAEIGAACETAGFFYVVDHGVPHDAGGNFRFGRTPGIPSVDDALAFR
jgi:isopenicillin N synthase-like dioxygenase